MSMCNAEIKKPKLNLTLGLLDLIDAMAEIASEIGMYAPKMKNCSLFNCRGGSDELLCLTTAINGFGPFLNELMHDADKDYMKWYLQIEKRRLTGFLERDDKNSFALPSISSRIKNIERNTDTHENKFKKMVSYVFARKSPNSSFNTANITANDSSNRLYMIEALLNAIESLNSQLETDPTLDKEPELNLTCELATLLATINDINSEMHMYSSATRPHGGPCYPDPCMDELKDLSDSVCMWRDIGKSIRRDSSNELVGALDWLEGELYIYLNYSDNAFARPYMFTRKLIAVRDNSSNQNTEFVCLEYNHDFEKIPKHLQLPFYRSKFDKKNQEWTQEIVRPDFLKSGKRTCFIRDFLQSTKAIKSKTVCPI